VSRHESHNLILPFGRNSMNRTASSNSIVREATKAFLAVVVLSAFASPVLAQSLPYSTVRNPLIDGAPDSPAMTAPLEGQPPPVGDGPTPAPEIPGMLGSPDAPPTMVDVPQVMGGDITDINSALAGSLIPPPSTPGIDPSNINGSSGGVGLSVAGGTIGGTNSSGVLASPVAIGNINANGGIPDLGAPTTRWAAQRSFDYGRNQSVVNNNASGYGDYGQRLPLMPNLKMQPSYSQDGPRTLNTAAIGQPIRVGNFPNAQATTDLYGNRSNFNPNYPSQMTIAPY
jgi:hypothetical protein